MALFRRATATNGSNAGGWLSGLLGAREFERRVDENFPTWQEYAEQKVSDAQEREDADKRVELPPHRVYISSPLHGSFLYFSLVVIALALGLLSPELAPVLVYAAIAVAALASLFIVFRDAIFLHIEALRLEADADMINRHARGPQDERDEKGLGFLRGLSRKNRNRKVFRSRLLQIHYQNVLRTFEQGNRRTWVEQDASIAELHTLLSQRGMKLVWTIIEVLPQLGLLGTLIGLMRMFLAFRVNVVSPELEILAGFATALGTTVVANLFVLVLRPLYMRNERTMHEILSTIQTLMAMFILPTQQTVLERGVLSVYGRMAMPLPGLSSMPPAAGGGINESRLYRTLDELTHALGEFTEVQQNVDSGTMARETAEIAQEVKQMLRAFQDAVGGNQLARQQVAIEQLGAAVQELAVNLGRQGANHHSADAAGNERIEKDLTQLRVLTHDTLLLLEQIAGRLDPIPARRGRMLSTDRGVRGKLFANEDDPGLTSLGDKAPASAEPGDEEGSQIRLFKERG